ncbi:MAG: hypothetical protein ACREF3_21245 [Acetobacteraceae bacterium]
MAAPLSPPAPPSPTPAPKAATVASPAPSTGPPGREQVAAISLGSLARQIDAALAGTDCALVNGAAQDSGAISVSGIAGTQAAETLHRAISRLAGSRPVDWGVRSIDPVFCSALEVLRPISPAATAPYDGLRLSLSGGRTALHDGDLIQPRVVMANFPGHVRVDYLAHDNTVAHIYPSVAEPSQHLVAVPARELKPHETLKINSPYVAGQPYGTDMIIAIASSIPLFPELPPQNAETDAAGFLTRLAGAIAAAQQKGASVTGTYMLVDTLPKG